MVIRGWAQSALRRVVGGRRSCGCEGVGFIAYATCKNTNILLITAHACFFGVPVRHGREEFRAFSDAGRWGSFDILLIVTNYSNAHVCIVYVNACRVCVFGSV